MKIYNQNDVPKRDQTIKSTSVIVLFKCEDDNVGYAYWDFDLDRWTSVSSSDIKIPDNFTWVYDPFANSSSSND